MPGMRSWRACGITSIVGRRAWLYRAAMATKPDPSPVAPVANDEFDPLADMTPEEEAELAADLAAAQDEVDRGETLDAEEVFAELRAKLEAMPATPRRRAP